MTDLPEHISIWGELSDVDHELRHVDVGDVRTRVLRAGSGPDLILLHGTGGHLEAYARDIAGLMASFRVTVYDMVGHGWSDLPDRPYTIDVLSDHLGAAIRASTYPGRVLLLASGGLSHWLPPNDPRDPSVDNARRQSVIHGRQDVRRTAAAREPQVLALAGDPNAPVNTEWDGWFLKQLSTADLDPVTALGDDGLEQHAGRGGHEIRTWLIGRAAVDRPLAWTSYEPVPEWITGMGIGTTFEVS